MDAKELRIGNYGKEITHSKNEVVKVSKRHFEDIEDGEIDLFPIPLTEQWLIDFGFDKSLDYYAKANTGFYFGVNLQGFLFPWFDKEQRMPLNIKYVHQIQNLHFSFTGKELIKI